MRLTIGPVAHGGHCVARHDGQVVFVRHTLPGEVVTAEITATGPKGRYLFADAVAIHEPSQHRVASRCSVAGPGGCGGCDWQHVDLPTQRVLKAAVLTEQLRRLGGVEREVTVHPVPGDEDGLSWRTRVRYAVAGDDVGFHAHASDRVIPVAECPIAVAGIRSAGTAAGVPVTRARWPGSHLTVISAASGTVVLPDGGGAAPVLRERAGGRDWAVPSDGFWQGHPGAAEALLALVMPHTRGAGTVWDLYSGVGLFAGVIAEREKRAAVVAVESHPGAVACARRNLSDLANARLIRADVLRWLRAGAGRADVVVLDPPRSGAGAKVLGQLDRRGVQTVVYVACDPAALGRDTRTLGGSGWSLDEVTGLDLFPMTHHVEAVAVFRR